MKGGVACPVVGFDINSVTQSVVMVLILSVTVSCAGFDINNVSQKCYQTVY
jgi:hypothetical protein